MKNFTILLITFLCNSALCQSQKPCDYQIGDILLFSQTDVSLKADSSINGKVITKITGSKIVKDEYSSFTDNYYNHFNLEVLDDKIINNFIKVKLTLTNDDSSFLINYLKYSGIICWVDKKFVEYPITIYPEGNGSSIEYYTESIKEMITLKILNSCEYDAYNLALCYQQRGIKYYYNKNYSDAIYDLTQSIEINPSYKKIIRSYYYRAYTKQALSDYYGAIDDYEIAIKKCYEGQKNKAYDFPCYICSTRNKMVNEFSFGQESCYEYLVCQKAFCNMMLEKNKVALTDLNLLISLYPNYGTAYYYRGQLKDYLNDTEGCCKDLSKAGELGVIDAYEQIKKRCNK